MGTANNNKLNAEDLSRLVKDLHQALVKKIDWEKRERYETAYQNAVGKMKETNHEDYFKELSAYDNYILWRAGIKRG